MMNEASSGSRNAISEAISSGHPALLMSIFSCAAGRSCPPCPTWRSWGVLRVPARPHCVTIHIEACNGGSFCGEPGGGSGPDARFRASNHRHFTLETLTVQRRWSS